MLVEKSHSDNEIVTFIAVLKYFNIYQPEEIYKIVCPFHHDVNASMQINVQKAFFFCYAECGAKGGSVELFRLFWQKEHPGEKIISDLKCAFEVKKIAKNELKNVSPYIYNNILYNTDVETKIDYKQGILQARDFYFNLPTLNWFKPEFDDSVEVKLYMKHRGFKSKTLNKAKAKYSFNDNYPIVFPMFENTFFRGYVMRTTDKEIETKRKYMYNRGFKRERTLAGQFGIYHGFGSLVERKTVIIVEGFLDKVKANQIGINNVVAILGWKISQTQIEKLKKAKIENIICATDNDEAGHKGYRYLKRVAQINNFSVFRLRYPKGIKDMGDIKADSVESKRVLNQIHELGGI